MNTKIYTIRDLGLRLLIKNYLKLSFTIKSPLRCLMETYLEKIVSDYKIGGVVVLDIGGRDKESKPVRKIIPHKKYFIANISKNGDVVFDATKTHPIKTEKIDVVISFNLIEHLEEYEVHIREMYRILKKNGWCMLFVPFSMYYHPDPKDYWRLTSDSLEMVFSKYFDNFYIIPVSLGQYYASMQYKVNIYNRLRILKPLFVFFNGILDLAFLFVYTFIKKIFSRDSTNLYKTYPTGYFVVARK